MCIGVPGQIVAVGEDLHHLATVTICGVKREINIALVCEDEPAALLGEWVLVHVGFAMSIIDEQQAKETLAALKQLES
jgi:hydrogenase expression/formation protein HypC